MTEQTRRVVSDEAIAAAEPEGWRADWSQAAAESALDPTAYVTGTRHDALGRAVEIVTPSDVTGTRRRIEPTYGRSGSLRAVAVDDVPYVRLIVHDARGQRVLIAYGNELITRYAWDPNTSRLARLRTEHATAADGVWTASGPPLQDLTYGYDLVGNLVGIDERVLGCGVAAAAEGRDRLLRSFEHDAFYRLTSATGRACADIGVLRPLDDVPRCGSYPAAPDQRNAPDVTTGYRESYRYDDADNLIDLLYAVTTGARRPSWHRVFAIGGLPAQDAARAPNNRLTGVRTGAAGGESQLGYDDAGNLVTQDVSRTFSWDHAGRLVGFRVSAGAGTSVSARYLYGSNGLRVKKWVRRGGTDALDESTVYIGTLTEHQRWRKAGGGSNTLLHVLDGASRIAILRAGAAHPDGGGPDELYVLADHLRSASLSVNATRSWVTREEYFPYGETSFGGFARKRYRFTGKERDEESGLSYHAARYLAPGLTRWISADPLGRAAGSNAYAYTRAQPLSRFDLIGTADTEARELLRWVQNLVDTYVPQGELPSFAGQAPSTPGTTGQYSHIVLEASITFGWEAPSNLNPERLLPEVIVNRTTGEIIGWGASPGRSGKGSRSIDLILLKEGVSRGDIKLGETKIQDVILASFDYKTGNAKLSGAKEIRALTNAPYYKLARGGSAERIFREIIQTDPAEGILAHPAVEPPSSDTVFAPEQPAPIDERLLPPRQSDLPPTTTATPNPGERPAQVETFPDQSSDIPWWQIVVLGAAAAAAFAAGLRTGGSPMLEPSPSSTGFVPPMFRGSGGRDPFGA